MTESYKVWLLKRGNFDFWTGRKWDMRPYNAKCYATAKGANEAMPAALKKSNDAVHLVEATLTVSCS